MTWTALTAEVALEFRELIDADRELLEWRYMTLALAKLESTRERHAQPKSVAKRVEWMRAKRASMTPAEKAAADAKAREYRRRYREKKAAER